MPSINHKSIRAFRFAGLSTVFAGLVFSSAIQASPILDGSGFSATPSATVTYDAGAPLGNFGSPGTTTSGAAYDIYVRGDDTYAYVLVKINGGGGTAAGSFANLYFGTGSSASGGSDLGFEVENHDAFTPGVSGSSVSTAGQGILDASLDGGDTIEFAVPFTYFETDPQSLGFTPTTAANPDIILRLSQSFGFSVAGGSSYGADRLGLIVDPIGNTPEPASIALFGSGLLAIGAVRLRRKRSN